MKSLEISGSVVDPEKSAFNARAKASMLIHLKSLTWPEKIASIERMNEAGRKARDAMKVARQSTVTKNA